MERLIMAGKLPDRNVFLPHVPKRVRTIIRKALKPDPVKRYQSASEFSAVIARVQPGLNWNTTVAPSGEIFWRTERLGKADLEVQLLKTAGTWNVHAWTVNGSSRRATGSDAVNRSGLDRNAAMAHLNDVFDQLA
jgi:hypothetical protein